METPLPKHDEQRVVWFSRLLRWGLGVLFIWAGIHFEGSWPAILFGLAFFITGFLRPKRCLDETCEIDRPPDRFEKTGNHQE